MGGDFKAADVRNQIPMLVQALQENLPAYLSALNDANAQSARADLNLQREISPGQQELELSLYDKYGREFNRVGNEIADQNRKAAIASELGLVQGEGGELARAAQALARDVDPEYYRNREALGLKIDELLADSSATPNESDRAEMERGISRLGLNPNSAVNTAEAALEFGGMKDRKRAMFADTLSRVSGMLPTLQSGADFYGIATGRTGLSGNAGDARFTGSQAISDKGFGAGTGMFNTAAQLEGQNQALRAQKHKSTMDKIQQGVQTFESLTSSVGNIAGMGMMCWVARAAYGENDMRWVMFREWLINRGPTWLQRAYCRYGPRFAQFISNKPTWRAAVRWLMNKAIYGGR